MSKLQQYQEYIAKLQANAIQVVSYDCPDCKEEIKTRAAPIGKLWDTLSICPHCDGMHIKLTNGDTAVGTAI